MEHRRARPGALARLRQVATFTGTQRGMTAYQIKEILQVFPPLNILELHHGCCIGADVQMHKLVRQHFPTVKIIGHPSNIEDKTDWLTLADCDEKNPSAPPLTRNMWMVDMSYHVIAAPFQKKNTQRSGTWSTIRYAVRQHGPARVHIVHSQ